MAMSNISAIHCYPYIRNREVLCRQLDATFDDMNAHFGLPCSNVHLYSPILLHGCTSRRHTVIVQKHNIIHKM